MGGWRRQRSPGHAFRLAKEKGPSIREGGTQPHARGGRSLTPGPECSKVVYGAHGALPVHQHATALKKGFERTRTRTRTLINAHAPGTTPKAMVMTKKKGGNDLDPHTCRKFRLKRRERSKDFSNINLSRNCDANVFRPVELHVVGTGLRKRTTSHRTQPSTQYG